jgi:hypothetical protein
VRKPDFVLLNTEVVECVNTSDGSNSMTIGKRGVLLQAKRTSYSLVRPSPEGESNSRRSSLAISEMYRNSRHPCSSRYVSMHHIPTIAICMCSDFQLLVHIHCACDRKM